jgi:hypothetical protein
MAVMLIRRMDSAVMARCRSLGSDRSDRSTPIDWPHCFTTGCTVQRSRAHSLGDHGEWMSTIWRQSRHGPRVELLQMINGKVVPTKAVFKGRAKA